VVDGRIQAETDLSAAGPRFSPDGRHIAYLAKRGAGWCVTVDGKPGPQFESERVRRQWYADSFEEACGIGGLSSSGDSRPLAYYANESGGEVVVLDGCRVGGLYDEVVAGGLSFHDNGVLEFLGIRDGVLYRVTAEA